MELRTWRAPETIAPDSVDYTLGMLMPPSFTFEDLAIRCRDLAYVEVTLSNIVR